MAQVNSCPGQNQVLGNVVVPLSIPYPPHQTARATAVLTTVSPAQSHVGSKTNL